VLDAAVRAGAAVDSGEIDIRLVELAARTEQGRMRRRSVKALVEGRDTRRNQLHLHTVQ
jgi:hypothetical protein